MEYWIWLTQLEGLGPIIQKRLLEHFKTPEHIYDASADELMMVSGVGEKLANVIVNSKFLSNSYMILEECSKKNISLLNYHDTLYPDIAKEDREAPILLYYKGVIRGAIEGIGIVGSRRTSDYGKRIALELGEYLGKYNIPVISGMAKGIDGYAHTGVLMAKGYTLAFLGCGVDICYPSEHKGLMEKIIESGAVISQYPPRTRPKNQHFPQRNNLIASWSRKILVVEAADKSGSLITAEIGKKLGREIFAVPHSIYSKTGVGTNSLLLKGAKPYLDKSQLMIVSDDGNTLEKRLLPKDKDNIGVIKQAKKIIDHPSLSLTEREIITCIQSQPKSIEQISFETGFSQLELLEELTVMELEAKIKVLPGGMFSCIG